MFKVNLKKERNHEPDCHNLICNFIEEEARPTQILEMSKVDLVNKIILSEHKTFLSSSRCFEMFKSFLKVLRPTQSTFNARPLIKEIKIIKYCLTVK